MKTILDVGEVFCGVPLARYKANEEDLGSTVRAYRPSQCKPTVTGFLPEPDSYCVREGFVRPKKVLKKGDILIASRFTHAGCAIFNGHHDICYPNESVFVIRPKDIEEGRFVADYLNSPDGKNSIKGISKFAKTYKIHCFNMSALKELKIPDISKEQMRAFSHQVALNRPKREPRLYEGARVGVARLMLDIQDFMKGAREAGMAESVQGIEVCSGKTHSVTITRSGVYQMENFDTGGVLVFRGDKIIASQNISKSDMDKFSQMAKLVQDMSNTSSPPKFDRQLAEKQLEV